MLRRSALSSRTTRPRRRRERRNAALSFIPPIDNTTQSANQYLDERSGVSVVNELSALGSRATW